MARALAAQARWRQVKRVDRANPQARCAQKSRRMAEFAVSLHHLPRYQETLRSRPFLTAAQEIDRLRRYGSIAQIFGRREAVRSGKDQPRHVRRAQGHGRDHPARRPRPRDADRRAGRGPVPGGCRPAFHPRDAGRRNRGGRRRDPADPDRGPARAPGRRSRAWRAHHAGAHSSAGGAAQRRRPPAPF